MNFILSLRRFWHLRNPSSTSTRGDDDFIMTAASEKPPVDDCCPICLSEFVVPCRGRPCGHWYCGGCIMKYWNHVNAAAFQPCNCPMCCRKITRLTPEPSYEEADKYSDVYQVLTEVQNYNRVFVGGGLYGFLFVVRRLPEYLVSEFGRLYRDTLFLHGVLTGLLLYSFAICTGMWLCQRHGNMNCSTVLFQRPKGFNIH